MNTVKQELVIAEQSEFIQMLERVAMKPDIDISKLSALLDMKERILAKQAETDFAASMSAAQADMGRIATDKSNNQTHSKYASYAAIDKEIRPIYTNHGFAMSFGTAISPIAEHALVYCDVSHRGGHTRRYEVNVPVDGKGAKGGDVMTKVHAFGAGIQYGMRYLARAIWNLAIGEDEDDDGNSGKPLPQIWQPQNKRKQYSTELQRAWGRGDGHGLKQLWDELDNEQKADVWRDFNSMQRKEMNELLVVERDKERTNQDAKERQEYIDAFNASGAPK